MPSSPHPPLKRHVSLQPFSRDHYVGLVQAQHLIKSADAGPQQRRKALAGFLQAWSDEIAAHFADEERLLPEFITGEPADRLRREHDELRARAAAAREGRTTTGMSNDPADPGADWVRELGQLLNDHIRWEERELFPLIERSAPPERLRALEDETAAIEQRRPRASGRARRGGQGSGGQGSGGPGGAGAGAHED